MNYKRHEMEIEIFNEKDIYAFVVASLELPAIPIGTSSDE